MLHYWTNEERKVYQENGGGWQGLESLLDYMINNYMKDN